MFPKISSLSNLSLRAKFLTVFIHRIGILPYVPHDTYNLRNRSYSQSPKLLTASASPNHTLSYSSFPDRSYTKALCSGDSHGRIIEGSANSIMGTSSSGCDGRSNSQCHGLSS